MSAPFSTKRMRMNFNLKKSSLPSLLPLIGVVVNSYGHKTGKPLKPFISLNNSKHSLPKFTNSLLNRVYEVVNFFWRLKLVKNGNKTLRQVYNLDKNVELVGEGCF